MQPSNSFTKTYVSVKLYKIFHPYVVRSRLYFEISTSTKVNDGLINLKRASQQKRLKVSGLVTCHHFNNKRFSFHELS